MSKLKSTMYSTLVIVFFCLLALGSSDTNNEGTKNNNDSSQEKTETTEFPLSIESFRIESSNIGPFFIFILKNNSNRIIKSAGVRISWYDKDGVRLDQRHEYASGDMTPGAKEKLQLLYNIILYGNYSYYIIDELVYLEGAEWVTLPINEKRK